MTDDIDKSWVMSPFAKLLWPLLTITVKFDKAVSELMRVCDHPHTDNLWLVEFSNQSLDTAAGCAADAPVWRLDRPLSGLNRNITIRPIISVGTAGGWEGSTPPVHVYSLSVFEWKSVLDFNPGETFQTLWHLTPQYFSANSHTIHNHGNHDHTYTDFTRWPHTQQEITSHWQSRLSLDSQVS